MLFLIANLISVCMYYHEKNTYFKRRFFNKEGEVNLLQHQIREHVRLKEEAEEKYYKLAGIASTPRLPIGDRKVVAIRSDNIL